MDATCGGVPGEIAYERVTPLAVAPERIGPRTALAALRIGRELVRCARSRTGVSKLTLALSVARALELTVDDDGTSLSSKARADLLTSLDDPRRSFDEVLGIDVSTLPDGAGVRMRSTRRSS